MLDPQAHFASGIREWFILVRPWQLALIWRTDERKHQFRQVTRQHKRDQWALDEVVTHTEAAGISS